MLLLPSIAASLGPDNLIGAPLAQVRAYVRAQREKVEQAEYEALQAQGLTFAYLVPIGHLCHNPDSGATFKILDKSEGSVLVGRQEPGRVYEVEDPKTGQR